MQTFTFMHDQLFMQSDIIYFFGYEDLQFHDFQCGCFP